MKYIPHISQRAKFFKIALILFDSSVIAFCQQLGCSKQWLYQNLNGKENSAPINTQINSLIKQAVEYIKKM